MEDARKPWERRENETPSQWRAFTLYLGMGPERSVSKAWAAYRGEPAEGQRAYRWFEDWSRQNSWYARACAYDQHQAEEGLRRLERARNEALDAIAAESANLAKTLIVMGRGVRPPLARGASEEDRVSDNVVASINKDLLDRIGARAPERVELTGRDGAPVQVETIDLSRLDDDELTMLLELRRKATSTGEEPEPEE